MKSDGGTLVYILLSIAFLIISAIGKNKKKIEIPGKNMPQGDPAPVNPPEPSGWPKELEDIFGKILDPNSVEPSVPDENMEPVVPDPQVQPATSQPAGGYFTYDNVPPLIESQEIIPATTEEMIEESHSDGLEFEVTAYSLSREDDSCRRRYLEDLDLEKAVVYSEILQRKYF